MAGGLAAALTLFIGAAIIFSQNVGDLIGNDNDRGSPLHETEGYADSVPLLSDLSGTGRSLAEELHQLHEGITIDWDTGLAYSDTAVDPGQLVTSAPGVFLVDTMLMGAYGTGTGIVLTPDGLAITNYHVVENSSSVTVHIADTEEEYSATVLGRDSYHDIAVLQIEDAENLPVASLNTDPPRVGDISAAVGNGSGQGYLTSVAGEVVSLNETIIATGETEEHYSRLRGLMRSTADVVPGYSGGPTIDSEGQVIGITTAASPGETSAEVDGYAIPVTVALSIVDQVLSGEETDTVSIGVDGALGVVVGTVEGAAVIQEVSEDSAAERLGLRVGDTVLQVEGVSVKNATELARAINDRNVGDEVEVTWRDTSGERHSGIAVLQEAVVN